MDNQFSFEHKQRQQENIYWWANTALSSSFLFHLPCLVLGLHRSFSFLHMVSKADFQVAMWNSVFFLSFPSDCFVAAIVVAIMVLTRVPLDRYCYCDCLFVIVLQTYCIWLFHRLLISIPCLGVDDFALFTGTSEFPKQNTLKSDTTLCLFKKLLCNRRIYPSSRQCKALRMPENSW